MAPVTASEAATAQNEKDGGNPSPCIVEGGREQSRRGNSVGSTEPKRVKGPSKPAELSVPHRSEESSLSGFKD